LYHGIVGWRPRRRRGLTKPDTTAAPAPDLVSQLFAPDQPEVAWCGDLTWIPTDEGWLSWPPGSCSAGQWASTITTLSWSATRWTPRWRELVRLPEVELVDRHHWPTRAQARAAIFVWIAWRISRSPACGRPSGPGDAARYGLVARRRCRASQVDGADLGDQPGLLPVALSRSP
jgi:hypothetical protein